MGSRNLFLGFFSLSFGFFLVVLFFGVADHGRWARRGGLTLAGLPCQAAYVDCIVVWTAELDLEADGLEGWGRRGGRRGGREGAGLVRFGGADFGAGFGGCSGCSGSGVGGGGSGGGCGGGGWRG